jgi:uncharacterized protein (TIGR02001 family)
MRIQTSRSSQARCQPNTGRPAGLSAKGLAFTAAATLFCTAAIEAHANGEPGPLSFNVGAYSQYVFRGLTQTNRRLALQAGVDYSSASGLYAGTWMSNISWFSDSNPGVRSPIEWDFYGGYRRSLGAGIGIDVGAMRYFYPGRYGSLPEGTVNPNTTELYVAASWHAASLKYSQAVTNANGVQHSVGSSYLDLTVTVPVRSKISATLHAGRQAFRGQNSFTESLGKTNDGLYTYNDYSAGLAASVGRSSSVSIVYTATTARDTGYLVQGRNLGSRHVAVGFVSNF